MIELLNTLSSGALIGVGLASATSIFVIVKVIYFSYHFYIDHGFILVEGSDHKEKIKSTLNKMGKEDSFFAVGYPFAAIVCVLFILFFGFIGHFWQFFLPMSLVVSFVLLPVFVIRVAAKDKRNKVVFVKKLDGSYDESV